VSCVWVEHRRVIENVVSRQAGRNKEAEMYYKRSVELRPDVSVLKYCSFLDPKGSQSATTVVVVVVTVFVKNA